jgi:hypothetical protein
MGKEAHMIRKHVLDRDCTCVLCGFDAAEFSWWKRSTYEGRASDATEPLCTVEHDENNPPVTDCDDEDDYYDFERE